MDSSRKLEVLVRQAFDEFKHNLTCKDHRAILFYSSLVDQWDLFNFRTLLLSATKECFREELGCGTVSFIIENVIKSDRFKSLYLFLNENMNHDCKRWDASVLDIYTTIVFRMYTCLFTLPGEDQRNHVCNEDCLYSVLCYEKLIVWGLSIPKEEFIVKRGNNVAIVCNPHGLFDLCRKKLKKNYENGMFHDEEIFVPKNLFISPLNEDDEGEEDISVITEEFFKKNVKELVEKEESD